MGSDVTDLIERLEAFEDRMGVRLEALFAHIDDNGFLVVNGEVHPRDGTTIEQDMNVHVDVYDSLGRLVAKTAAYLSADSFFGFEAFDVCVELPIQELSKIRVYPKVS